MHAKPTPILKRTLRNSPVARAEPESWVRLKLVITGKELSAFVNGADKPALAVTLLNARHKGKLGLWVGNGSDGWFKNLKVDPSPVSRVVGN